jgi:RNA polymerase sigma-70 factor (ECF subfamily)
MQERQTYMPEAPTAAVQICRQNSGEFEDVVSRYLPALYRRAYRFVGDRHDAEDAVQDALLSAYKHLDQFKGNAKMATWLTSIVTNSALTQLRKRPRQPHVSLDEPLDEQQDYRRSDTIADVRPSPESECVKSELFVYLMQFVAELSPSLRRVIQLHHLEGLTTNEAAQVLGVAEGTVKAQVSRARSKLRQMASAV